MSRPDPNRSRVLPERPADDDALREAAALLRAISDASDDVIFAKDRQGRLRFANPATLALIGKDAHAVLGRTDAEFLEDPAAARQVMENDRRVMESGEASELEEIVPLPDGTPRVWLSRKTPWRDAQGRVVGLLGISRDITDRKRAEAALRASEERWRALFTNMTEGFALGEALCDEAGTPRDFRFLEMNDAFERQSGLRRAEVRGRPMRQVLPGLEQSWVDIYCGVALGGPARRFENYNVDLDRHFDVYCYRPAPGRFAILFTDVTERHRADEALRARERQYRSLAENSPEVIARFDRALRHVYVNEYGAQVYGVPREQVLGRTNAELGMPPEKVEFWRRHFEQVFATGEQRTVEFDFDSPTFGPQRFSSLFVPERDERGEVASVLAITRDVTPVRQAEERARRERELLSALIDRLPVLVTIGDPRRRSVRLNEEFRRVLGWTEQDAPDGDLLRLLYPDPALRAQAAGHLAAAAPGWREFPATARDGTLVPASWASFRLADDTQVGIGLDLRDRLRAEAALREANARLVEADGRKNEFLAVLSHELRNPLAPIRSSVYVLERAAPGGEQARRALRVIDRQAAQLARLVDDLLDITRIERGKIRLQREPTDLRELVVRTAEDHRAQLEAAGLELRVRADAPVPARVDPVRAAQIVGNLLGNAAKFTPRGGRVELSLRAEGAQAVVRVRDTGVGIAPDVLERLFQPFTQAHQTLERTQGGLGLGLALVKGLAELHGGSVEASSDGPGAGAEFVVRLPAEPAGAPASPGSAAEARPGRALRVLVVEDNADAAESLKAALELDGHAVETAPSGPDGLARARQTHPDVVLCDLGLPGMDGFEVARALRADGGPASPYLVALSGYAQPEDVEKAGAAGFDRHIAKPPPLRMLQEALADAAAAHGPGRG